MMTVAELRAVLDAAVVEAPTAEIPDVIDLLAAVQAKLLARLAAPAPPVGPSAVPIDAEAAAVALNVPVSQIYALARQKRIPVLRIGKYVRFDLAAVRAALAEVPGSKTAEYRPRKRHPNTAISQRKNGRVSSATALLPSETPEAARA